MQRKIINRLSEKEGELLHKGPLGIDEFAQEMDLDWEEIQRQLNLCQDDGLLEWSNLTLQHFDFRITAEGYRFLQSTSED